MYSMLHTIYERSRFNIFPVHIYKLCLYIECNRITCFANNIITYAIFFFKYNYYYFLFGNRIIYKYLIHNEHK